MKKGLIGKGKLSLLGDTDITPELEAAPVLLRASQNGAMVLVACADGERGLFPGGFRRCLETPDFRALRRRSRRSRWISSLAACPSCVTAPDGRQEQWSLFRRTEGGERVFGKTKTFPKLPRWHGDFRRQPAQPHLPHRRGPPAFHPPQHVRRRPLERQSPTSSRSRR